MRIGLKMMAGLVASTLVSGTVLAGDIADNAALRYWRAWTLMDNAEEQPVFDIDLDSLGQPAWQHPEGMEASLKDLEPFMDLIEEAAAMPACDFGIDYHHGFEALLPHLRAVRKTVKLLAVDARVHLDAGDTDECIDRLVAAYGITSDIVDDRTLISSLVTMASFKALEPVTDFTVEHGALTNAQATRLLDAIEVFDAEDPFNIRASMLTERDMVGNWVRRHLGDPEVRREVGQALQVGTPKNELSKEGQRLFDVLGLLSGADDISDADLRLMGEILVNNEDLQKDIRLYEEFFELAVATFEDPEGLGDLRKLESALEAGDFGRLSLYLAPAITRMHSNYWTSRDMITEAKERFAE